MNVLKKILLITGNLFAGLNFGILSAFMPIFLVIEMIMFGDGFLNFNILAVNALIIAALASLIAYIYAYRKKREHESVNINFLVFMISLVLGAILIAVLFFIGGANEMYDITP